jgi:hypothetical protein
MNYEVFSGYCAITHFSMGSELQPESLTFLSVTGASPRLVSDADGLVWSEALSPLIAFRTFRVIDSPCPSGGKAMF